MTYIHSLNRVVDSSNADTQSHQWVTVVNPTNRRLLLQACDNCGVVKSENTVVQACRQPAGQGLITRSLMNELSQTA